MEFYFLNGLAESTRKTYDSAKKRYREFCTSKQFCLLPASESQLCQFVSQLANDHLSHTTIKCYLAAVRHAHIEGGVGDPKICGMARLEQVLKGIKSVQCRTRPPNRPTRLPITPDLLRKMKQSWQVRVGPRRDSAMLWAAATLCFFGFFRSGEITVLSESAFDEGAHLTFKDVTVDCMEEPKLLRVKLKTSKTDPFRVGVEIFVGRTDNELCPVAAVLAYMAMRGSGPGPLFKFCDGSPLTRAKLVAEVRRPSLWQVSTAGLTWVTASEVGQLLQQPNKVWVMRL